MIHAHIHYCLQQHATGHCNKTVVVEYRSRTHYHQHNLCHGFDSGTDAADDRNRSHSSASFGQYDAVVALVVVRIVAVGIAVDIDQGSDTDIAVIGHHIYYPADSVDIVVDIAVVDIAVVVVDVDLSDSWYKVPSCNS